METDVVAGTGGCAAICLGKIILPGNPVVSDLALSPDGRLLACGVSERGVIIVDLHAGQATGLLKIGGDDTDHLVYSSVAFSPKQELLAAGAGKDVLLWRLDPTGQPQEGPTRLPAEELIPAMPRLTAATAAVRFSPDGRFLAVTFYSWSKPIPHVFVFDVATRQPACTLSVPKKLGAQADPFDIAFFHGNAGLAAISWGLKICRWPVPGARTLWAVRHPDLRGSYRYARRYGIAVSPDDTQVAVGSGDETRVHLLNASTGASVRTLTTTTSWVSSLAYSPDGKRLVCGTTRRGGMVEVFDLASPAATAVRKIEVLGDGQGDLGDLSVALHPVSGRIVAGGGDTVQVFESEPT